MYTDGNNVNSHMLDGAYDESETNVTLDLINYSDEPLVVAKVGKCCELLSAAEGNSGGMNTCRMIWKTVDGVRRSF